jgi:hypothetical protein
VSKSLLLPDKISRQRGFTIILCVGYIAVVTVKNLLSFCDMICILSQKNSVFWDVVPCIICVNRRFGRMYLLHIQGRKIGERGTSVSKWLQTEPPVDIG